MDRLVFLLQVVPPIVLGQQTVVLSITEAFAGSDVAGLRTTAVLDASGENYIVNGTKKWITGGMCLKSNEEEVDLNEFK